MCNNKTTATSKLKTLLLLLVPPQIAPFDFGEEIINSGELVSVTCSVHKGDLPIEITWFHNGKPIFDGDGLTIMKSKKVNTLSIESVSFENAGEYTCVAKNTAGSTSQTAVLNVNGTILCINVLNITPFTYPNPL